MQKTGSDVCSTLCMSQRRYRTALLLCSSLQVSAGNLSFRLGKYLFYNIAVAFAIAADDLLIDFKLVEFKSKMLFPY